MLPTPEPVAEFACEPGAAANGLPDAVLRSTRPLVLRGLVGHWPLVQAARQSPDAASAYLLRFYRGATVGVMLGPAEFGGRFFYNDAVDGFNFRQFNSNAVVRYEITVTNSGPGTVDAGTLVITDPIPANSIMYVAGAGPVVFLNGTTASGLTFTYASHVTYSSVGSTGPWNYTPAPDVNGFDALVRAIRIAPAGVMSAAGAGNPSFTIQFQVKIQ